MSIDSLVNTNVMSPNPPQQSPQIRQYTTIATLPLFQYILPVCAGIPRSPLLEASQGGLEGHRLVLLGILESVKQRRRSKDDEDVQEHLEMV